MASGFQHHKAIGILMAFGECHLSVNPLEQLALSLSLSPPPLRGPDDPARPLGSPFDRHCLHPGSPSSPKHHKMGS